MECGDTPCSVISIWIQIWIWIQSMNLHGVSIYMEFGDTPHSIISIWIQIWI